LEVKGDSRFEEDAQSTGEFIGLGKRKNGIKRYDGTKGYCGKRDKVEKERHTMEIEIRWKMRYDGKRWNWADDGSYIQEGQMDACR
jgi:hypothetical protein